MPPRASMRAVSCLLALSSLCLAVSGCTIKVVEQGADDGPDGNASDSGASDGGEGTDGGSDLPGEPGLKAVEFCPEPPTNAVQVNAAELGGDTLKLELSYGGGCEAHAFKLCTDGAFLESYPVQTSLWVVDVGPSDPCEAWLTSTHSFDVSPIKRAYEDAYLSSEGSVILNVGKHSVRYDFGASAAPTCQTSLLPSFSFCNTGLSAAGRQVVTVTDQCGGCQTHVLPCQVLVNGQRIEITMEREICLTDLACPAVCAVNDYECELPELADGDYAVSVNGSSATTKLTVGAGATLVAPSACASQP
jgi:hypothetical protein